MPKKPAKLAGQGPSKGPGSLQPRLQTAIEFVPALVSYVDAEGCYRFVNNQYEKWFGLSSSKILGKHYRQVLDEKTFTQIRGFVETALAGQDVTYEAELHYSHGGPRWVMAHYVPDFDEAGRVRGFFALVNDITDRKQAEQALRESEQRLLAIVDTATDAIITIDRQGIIQSFNPAAQRMFGYAAAEAIGQNVNSIMPSPYREEHDGYLRRFLETGEARIIGTTRQLLGARRDGSTFPMELSVSRIDHLNIFTGIIRDTTQRKELQTEVLRIAEEEQRRIGHDLHDTVGQELTGLGYVAQTLVEALADTCPEEVATAPRQESNKNPDVSNVEPSKHLLAEPLPVEASGKREGDAACRCMADQRLRVLVERWDSLPNYLKLTVEALCHQPMS